MDSGANINSEYYSKLVQTARKKRRKSRLCDFFYLADIASVQTSEFSTEVVKGCGLTALSHSPYSHDLAPSDFYLFTHLKKHLCGNRFNTKDELKEAVTNWLHEKPSGFYEEVFLELIHRWKTCVMVDGSYIEKWNLH